jgi:hypothetical protein
MARPGAGQLRGAAAWPGSGHGGSDAADRDTQLGADPGEGHRRVLDQQRDQLLTAGEVRERLAQRRATLGHQQFLFLTCYERLAGAL